jgi:zinc transporter ZupT
MTAADLPDATSIDDAAATRTRANALVLAAGAAGATAVGATIGAVAADAVGVGLRVRF